MGSPDPRSFSRGKRGIAGTMVFTQFDRDALVEEMKQAISQNGTLGTFQTFAANSISSLNKDYAAILDKNLTGNNSVANNVSQDQTSMAYWDTVMSTLGYNNADLVNSAATIEYADQIPPFHIAITFANEYGQRAKLEIHNVELLNEGAGYSIDDVVSSKSFTFIARKISYLKPTTK